MADTTPPAAPDFQNNLPALGGDLRLQAHRLLRQSLREGQQQFASIIEEELQHCLAHYLTAYALVQSSLSEQRLTAGLHRSLFFVTTQTADRLQRIGFREPNSEIIEREIVHRIYNVAEGLDPQFMIGNGRTGTLRLLPRYNIHGRLTHFEVERVVNAPEGATRDQYSLSNLLPGAVGQLFWSENALRHWTRGSTSTVVLQGAFDTRRHLIRQSLDTVRRLLAFAANRDVFLLDLRAYLRSEPYPPRTPVHHFYQASSPVGGIALWEAPGGTCWWTTHPERREIQLGFTAEDYGLVLPWSPSEAIQLPTALLDGNAFTLEFQYRLPENNVPHARIPLIGGMGFPSLSLVTDTGAWELRWTFPDHPTLTPVEWVIPGTLPLSWGTWMHVALTCDHGKLVFYLNGNPVDSLQIHPDCPLPPAPAALVLGDFQAASAGAREIGTFAELRTWSRPRTSAEIQNHYATWIVASEAGLPDDLVLYHRFWGPGALNVRTVGSSSIAPELSATQDLARPAPIFEIERPTLGMGPETAPFNSPRRWYKTRHRLGNWIAADPKSGMVSWGEQHPDGKWYLMQAPAAGHLPPLPIQEISAWEAALVRSPYPFAGDLVAWAAQAEGALLRQGYQQQVFALRQARTQVDLAYQAVEKALDQAEAEYQQDSTRAAHADAHINWIAARNQAMQDEFEADLNHHAATSEGLRTALAIVQSAEAQAMEIRKAALLRRMGGKML